MFRSIVFLIAGNVVSRAFYTIAMLVLAETYSPDIFSEIIFTATVLLFLGAVGPLRFELAILEDNVNDKILASYLLYAVAACLIVFIMLIYFDKKIFPILILMSLYSNIGMVLMITKGREELLLLLRTTSSLIGAIFIIYNYSAKLNPQLVFVIVMMCYLSSSLLSFIYAAEAVPLRARIIFITKHIKLYYAQILETVFITFAGMALVLILQDSLAAIDYTYVALASQLFISSAILVGSSLSHKYLNLLNKDISLIEFFVSYRKIVILVFLIYVSMISFSIMLPGYGLNLLAFEAASKYGYFIIVSMLYVIVIPFSSIMIFRRKLHLNFLIHLGGLVARVAPLLLLNGDRAIIYYILMSSAFYIFYGWVIFREHKDV